MKLDLENVSILGRTHRIIYQSNPILQEPSRDVEVWGTFDRLTGDIRLYQSGLIPDYIVWGVLIHEILHGVFFGALPKVFLDEEQQINELCESIYGVLISNNLTRMDEETLKSLILSALVAVYEVRGTLDFTQEPDGHRALAEFTWVLADKLWEVKV